MLKTISEKKAEAILAENSPWIQTLSERYRIPQAVIKAILYMEMTGMDIMDPIADAVVRTGLFSKKDSSTGYAQIFGWVGIKAVNFAADRGMTDYEKLHIPSDRRLDPRNQDDVRLMWKYLRSNKETNMEVAVLNMLCAAEEMTGRIDFSTYSEEELKLVLTRYNADTDHITRYGEEAYRHYLRYLESEKKESV